MSSNQQHAANRRVVWNISNFTKAQRSNRERSYKLYSDPFEILIGENKTIWRLMFEIRYCYIFLIKESDISDLYICWKITDSKLVLIFEGVFRIKKNVLADEKQYFIGNLQPDNVFNNQNFVSNETLTLILDIELYQSYPEKTANGSKGKLSEIVKNLFNSNSYSDFTIISSDGKMFSAHQCILAGRSSVFKAMLSTEMIEKKLNKIKVKDIDGDTMHELLKFIYTEEVENSNNVAKKLIYAAEKYDLPELKSICISKLINEIAEENIFEILLLADRFNEEILLNKCMLFIKSNYDELENRNEWNNIDIKLIKRIMKFLKDNSDIICLSNQNHFESFFTTVR
ncbi:hypothetical protein PVAND_001016 [Polypedilum vanderplanki]|uniref:BTB domain-containing protein n=1 Tax=Polypedilum vanderplanki TaxID=319348 RepID=A0A9J6BM22_POLVA|nr:hypothetical protein PVAND_001016 [Polypedilum vanderplanki]